MLKTSSSTRYYSVRGTTTGAIFDDIEKNGLFDTKARRAIGLTSGEWSIDWRGIETRPALCSPESMTITLKLVVTLPQHDQLNDLSQRSEEHTSELQSQSNLVCRLLLEKKKKNKTKPENNSKKH